MEGKIPKLYKMHDVYNLAKSMGLLKTSDGYIVSEYEFSKIIHSLYFEIMSRSIREKKPYEFLYEMTVYPVQTLCTRYIPKKIVKDESGELKKVSVDVSKYGFSFAFLFLGTNKKYRGFRFKTAQKIKNIITEARESGEKFFDITLSRKDQDNTFELLKKQN